MELGRVLKWAYVYYSIEVATFDTLDEAISVADDASDAGSESLICLEIPSEGRVIDAKEVRALAAATRPVYVPQPLRQPVAELILTAPNGETTRQRFSDSARAQSDAQEWERLIGPDRVEIRWAAEHDSGT